MKTHPLTHLSLVLALSGMLMATGCAQSSSTNAESIVSNDQPAAIAPVVDNSVPAPAENTTAPLPVPQAEPILPPNILPGTPLAEVVRLAQAGVDENVMRAFITNSGMHFNLGAEEIVYLNDLGVSGSVITTMMQQDQGLKSLPLNAVPPTTPELEPEPVAAAPTYVNPPPAAPPAEAQPTYVSNNYFYDSLAPYGNWIEVQGYGRCWRPTVVVVNRSWQPYCDRGRWVYTDAGWYWLSDYSWGATTFHYGRWFSHPSWGWCWWPDTVWAPSWVSWRYSGAYCGWAPLPPTACYRPGFGFSYYGSSVGFSFGFGIAASCYTFIPMGRMCDARPYHYRLPAHHATELYRNSTVMNNYGSGKDNHVINHGIAPERIREHTRTEIRTVQLREAGAVGRPIGRREQLDFDGRTLVVNRPNLTEAKGGLGVQASSAIPQAVGRPVGASTQHSSEMRPSRSEPSAINTQRGVANPVPLTPSTAGGRPASTPTGKIDNPRAIQVSPQLPARPVSPAPRSSLVIIGGKGNTRSGGSDYSVWSTPAPVSRPNASGNSLGLNNTPPSASTRTPSASRPLGINGSVVNGGNPNESRGSYSTYSTPAPRAVAPEPRISSSIPSYSPRPSPAPRLDSPRGSSLQNSRPIPSSSSPARGGSQPQPRSGSTIERQGR